MLEIVLYTLIFGLFIFGVCILRNLTKRQINNTIKTLVEDWEAEPNNVKMKPELTQPIIIQKSNNRLKD